MRTKITLAAAVGLALSGMAARAQTTGVSHPDPAIIEATPDSSAAPPAAKPSPYVTASPAPVAPLAYSAAPSALSNYPAHSSRTSGMGEGLGPDIDANVVTRVAGPANRLPLGTLLKFQLHQRLSTSATKVGTGFDGELTEPVERDGKVLIPAGSLLEGRVTQVHGGRRVAGRASIHLLPLAVTLPDGTRYSLHAQVIDTDLYKGLKVDSEGTIVRRDHPKETLAVMGGIAGTGAAAGGVVGGVPGALVGAGVGAGVGTAWWLKQDRQAEIPARTKIILSLTDPLVVGR